jgi:hypothetical protein
LQVFGCRERNTWCDISESDSHMREREFLSKAFFLLLVYGVRPSETHTLEDQLGLVPGTKLKIEDGSTVGTSVTLWCCGS